MTIRPLTAAPVRPQAAAPAAERFDLSRIDTPVEAVLMPMVDLVAAMAAGNDNESGAATVTVRAEGQELTYTMRPAGEKVELEGTMNGAAFKLEGSADPGGLQVQFGGATPGGDIRQVLTVQPGGFHIAGQAGDVAFEETLSLNPFGGLTGEIASIQGQVGGEALQEEIKVAEDGQTLRITGTLGERAIDTTMTQGADGSILVSGTLGSTRFEETIVRH